MLSLIAQVGPAHHSSQFWAQRLRNFSEELQKIICQRTRQFRGTNVQELGSKLQKNEASLLGFYLSCGYAPERSTKRSHQTTVSPKKTMDRIGEQLQNCIVDGIRNTFLTRRKQCLLDTARQLYSGIYSDIHETHTSFNQT